MRKTNKMQTSSQRLDQSDTSGDSRATSTGAGRWMDKINDFSILAESQLLKSITDDLHGLLLAFSAELDCDALKKQFAGYFEYADKTVTVIERGKQVPRRIFYLLLRPTFECADPDDLEDGYFQLLLYPDFQLIHPLIEQWYKRGSDLRIEWSRTRELIDIALRTLTKPQQGTATGHAVKKTARLRNPQVVARRRFSQILSGAKRTFPLCESVKSSIFIKFRFWPIGRKRDSAAGSPLTMIQTTATMLRK